MFALISSFPAIGDNKKSGWEDNNETIVPDQEVQYELLDVEDEKFYRGKKNIAYTRRTISLSCASQNSIIFLTTIWILDPSKVHGE